MSTGTRRITLEFLSRPHRTTYLHMALAIILDMHLHTAISDDGTASIDGYIETILAYRAIHPWVSVALVIWMSSTESPCHRP